MLDDDGVGAVRGHARRRGPSCPTSCGCTRSSGSWWPTARGRGGAAVRSITAIWSRARPPTLVKLPTTTSWVPDGLVAIFAMPTAALASVGVVPRQLWWPSKAIDTQPSSLPVVGGQGDERGPRLAADGPELPADEEVVAHEGEVVDPVVEGRRDEGGHHLAGRDVDQREVADLGRVDLGELARRAAPCPPSDRPAAW